MKKIYDLMFVFMIMAWVVPLAATAEEAVMDNSMKMEEPAGTVSQIVNTATNAVTDATVIETVKRYIEAQSATTGTFDINDPVTNTTRKLSLDKVQDKIGKTEGVYNVCVDFKDTANGDTLDVDVNVADEAGELIVADVKIHKVNDVSRFTNDDNMVGQTEPPDKNAIMEEGQNMMGEMKDKMMKEGEQPVDTMMNEMKDDMKEGSGK